MEVMQVKDYIESYFKVSLHDKGQSTKFLLARTVFCKIMHIDYGFSVQEIAESLGRTHATVINSIKKFDGYYRDKRAVRKCYRDLSIKLGLIEPMTVVKQSNVDMQVAIEMLTELESKELKDFLPRIDLYLKSVKYNRKKKQQWERT
jgi:predicted transcriptional regulator